MKNYLLTLLLIISLGFNAKAQYVTIPDPNFVTFLQTNYPQCINGNQMDTTCSAVLTDTLLDCGGSYNVSNLEGIQYFKGLKKLYCVYGTLTHLNALPTSLIELHIADNNLTSLPALPTSLKVLNCSFNNLGTLPALPPSLNTLQCYECNLTTLPPLPPLLNYIRCDNNSITILPTLPASIATFHCYNNSLTSLPTLPASLTNLNCYNNSITSLPALPASLISLSCGKNNLTSLPSLPASLTTLTCSSNNLSILPPLPALLNILDCSYNNLSSIPELLNQNMNSLYFGNNHLLACLPQLPASIGTLSFNNTSITCLPNYPIINGTSTPLLNSIPLCDLFNNNGCLIYSNINGISFFDTNNNCNIDSNEFGIKNIKYELWNGGTLIKQTYTLNNSYYSFNTDSIGSYVVRIDTNNLPFNVVCPANQAYYDSITSTTSNFYNNDFALNCKPGYDVGINTISSINRFRPGNNSNININAGDITNFYGAHCAAGAAGAVTVIINGPAHYTGPASGALTPTTVNGDTIIWNVADFGLVNALTDFNIVVQTDTFAPIGSQVCFTVSVTPTIGDNNPSNNTLTHCFIIVNSYDPNEKEVYPSANIDTAQEWLTYTVHFQNTGTAEAQHIYVMDTLDANVDEASFQLLAYSHQPHIQINEKIVRFNFPNINLPDSTTDEPNSHGYVQYKVKLKHGLPIGTQISNTAYIYFDFNSPVVTNTVTNTIAVDTSVTIGLPTIVNDQPFDFTLYPNPANQQFTISATAAGSNVIIYNAVGNVVANFTMCGTAQTFNISNLPSGVYVVKVMHDARAAGVKRLVKY